MRTIDYIYRFDPKNPSVKPPPEDQEAARSVLEAGNHLFSEWMESCRTGTFSQGEPRYVVQCNGLEVGMVRSRGHMPKQAPFAVVVGCSDARVPMEMLFGQGFNDLFVIRVAGNVLADECWGSIDFALTALADSVKLVVVLGHTGCGAVSAAVDAYLKPARYSSARTSSMLRSILHRIFVPVHQAATGLRLVWGDNAEQFPGYRAALIESAVTLNVAHASYALYLEVERGWRSDVQVLTGVYNLHTHHVSMPPHDPGEVQARMGNLAFAPAHPRDFDTLSILMAERLLPWKDGVPIEVAPWTSAQPLNNGSDSDHRNGGAEHPAGDAAATQATILTGAGE